MLFHAPLVPGRLLRRYKRFLADVELEGGEVIVAHCPNPGSMKSCAEPGWPVWVSPASNPARKLKWTLEVVLAPTTSILVNTARPNHIVREAIEAGQIPELTGYGSLRAEVRYGEEKSRIDLLLEDGKQANAWVEVKNATLLLEPGVVGFPDSVTTRGTRHLRELMRCVAQGDRGVLFFLVSRSDGKVLSPARDIDPTYASTLDEAVSAGVEVLAYRAEITDAEVRVGERVGVELAGAFSGAPG